MMKAVIMTIVLVFSLGIVACNHATEFPFDGSSSDADIEEDTDVSTEIVEYPKDQFDLPEFRRYTDETNQYQAYANGPMSVYATFCNKEPYVALVGGDRISFVPMSDDSFTPTLVIPGSGFISTCAVIPSMQTNSMDLICLEINQGLYDFIQISCESGNITYIAPREGGRGVCWGLSVHDRDGDGFIEVQANCDDASQPTTILEQTSEGNWEKVESNKDFFFGASLLTVCSPWVYPLRTVDQVIELRKGIFCTSDAQALYSTSSHNSLHSGGLFPYRTGREQFMEGRELIERVPCIPQNGCYYGAFMGSVAFLTADHSYYLISDALKNRIVTFEIDSTGNFVYVDHTLAMPELAGGGVNIDSFYNDVEQGGSFPSSSEFQAWDQQYPDGRIDLSWGIMIGDYLQDGMPGAIVFNGPPPPQSVLEPEFDFFGIVLTYMQEQSPLLYRQYPGESFEEVSAALVGFEQQNQSGLYCENIDCTEPESVNEPCCSNETFDTQLRGAIQVPCNNSLCFFIGTHGGMGDIYLSNIAVGYLEINPTIEIVNGGGFYHLRDDSDNYWTDRPWAVPVPQELSHTGQMQANGGNIFAVQGQSGYILFPSGYVARYDLSKENFVVEPEWVKSTRTENGRLNLSFTHLDGVDSVNAICFYQAVSLDNKLLGCVQNPEMDNDQSVEVAISEGARAYSVELTVRLPSIFTRWTHGVNELRTQIHRAFPIP